MPGLAMRLILPGGEHAATRVDEKLIKAIARAHGWWGELMENPDLGIAGLAARHGISESWATRMLRLAFLDPAIIELVLDGKAPAHFTLETLKDPDAVSALWADQRKQHRISITR